MLPLILKPALFPTALIGGGEKLELRRRMLEGSGFSALTVYDTPETWPDAAAVAAAPWKILYIAGMETETALPLAAAARQAGMLLNLEDVPDWCDFYVPAVVRRGDLLVTVSTGGTASGVSKILREYLEIHIFPPTWGERLAELAAARREARIGGAGMAEVMALLRRHIAAKGWLPHA